MNNELLVAKREKLYRELSDGILFDIKKFNWNPSCETLERFCEKTRGSIVKKYKELEKTQEFIFTGETLYAMDRSECTDLVFILNGGFVGSENTAVYSLGRGFQALFKKHKRNPNPFDFKLLIVGYKGINEGDDGGPLPILDKIVNF